VLAEASGACPLQPDARSETVCRRTRYGNGVTGSFALPKVPWGVDYAYNCGPTSSEFSVMVGLPSMDGQMPETGFSRRGKSGRGYYVETGRGLRTLANLPSYWQYPENLEISSACTWHVLAVVGSVKDLRQRVPAIPHWQAHAP
jgi:hypothetical protein